MTIHILSGCNLSPLLFSLFITSLGSKLNASGLGITLGSVNISCICFADDIVLIGQNKECLNHLMTQTLGYFAKHRLTLSVKKSKVMLFNSATGSTTFTNSDSSLLSLEQVLSFKYLGIHLNFSPYLLFKDFNEQAKKKSKAYLASVLSISKTGPDMSSLAYTLWTSVALPSILYGSEIIPLTKGTINEIEKAQSAVGKFILQIPSSSANVSSNIDGGLKPIWAVVAERVLLFAHSTMGKPDNFWPKLAMTENLSKGTQNPYTRYLMRMKSDSNIVSLSPKLIKNSVHRAAVVSVLDQQKQTYQTTFAMNGADSTSKERWFRLKSWVTDSSSSRLIAQFRACNIGLGNRGPTVDGQFFKLCPLCLKTGVKALNNEVNSLIPLTQCSTNKCSFF